MRRESRDRSARRGCVHGCPPESRAIRARCSRRPTRPSRTGTRALVPGVARGLLSTSSGPSAARAQQPRRRRQRPSPPTARAASCASLARARDRQPRFELFEARRTDATADRDSIGRDDVALGLAGRPEAREQSVVEHHGPRDALVVDVRAHGALAVVADEAEHREVGFRLVTLVERAQRRLLLLTGEAPRVPDVDEIRLALECLAVDRSAVECLGAELRNAGLFLDEVGHARFAAMLRRQHDAERDEHDDDGERDPTNRLLHVATSASSTGSPAASSVTSGMTDRRRAGVSARSTPRAMIAPPIQSHTTSVPTCTAIVTRPPSSGSEISVRYTSRNGPVCTDGVPMPFGKFGYVEIAGEYVPSPSIRTFAFTVVFWSDRSVSLPR